MGEKKDGGQNDGDQKKKAGDGSFTVVLKIDLHSDDYARKVKHAVKKFDGVQDVKVDNGANKITVIGKVDPAKLRECLEEKTHKKVELVSHSPSPPPPPPQPKKDGGAAKKKPEGKKSAEEGKKKKAEVEKPKESKLLKFKVEGVESMTIDKGKERVTLKGTKLIGAVYCH